MKKKIHNGKRGKAVRKREDSIQASGVNEDGAGHVDEVTIKHLQTVLSMIEGRNVAREEVLELVRQHSIAKEKESRYSGDDADKPPGDEPLRS
jgi:hypothetical protein